MSGIVRPNNTGQSGIVANVETIDSDDYVDGSIDNAHLANDAVGADELASDAVVNASIASGAAVAFSKMANLTASRALVSDGSGDVSVSAVTSTEIGYLDGVTSAIQTQIDAAGGPTEATKSNMEAEATGTIYVPPDLVKNSPGVAKCWINIHGTDTFAVEQSYNCDGATDESTGTYEVTVTTNFAGANNNCIVCGGHDGVTSDPRFNVGVTGANLTVGTFRIIGMLEDGTTGISAVADGTDIMAAVFGDQ
jgi:hypothetical protein